jgi:hypothetical protein
MESLFTLADISNGVELWHVRMLYEGCVNLHIDADPECDLREAIGKLASYCLTFNGDACKMTFFLHKNHESLAIGSICHDLCYPLASYWIDRIASDIESHFLKPEYLSEGVYNIVVRIKRKC